MNQMPFCWQVAAVRLERWSRACKLLLHLTHMFESPAHAYHTSFICKKSGPKQVSLPSSPQPQPQLIIIIYITCVCARHLNSSHRRDVCQISMRAFYLQLPMIWIKLSSSVIPGDPWEGQPQQQQQPSSARQLDCKHRKPIWIRVPANN